MPTEHRHHYHRTYSLNVKSFANAVMYIKYIHRPIALCFPRTKKTNNFSAFPSLVSLICPIHSLCISGVKSGSFEAKRKLRADFLCACYFYSSKGLIFIIFFPNFVLLLFSHSSVVAKFFHVYFN